MGGRRVSLFGPSPFSSTFSICASVKLGRPASGGAWSAQFRMGAMGLIQMGAPWSQDSALRLPEASRGVWHSEQRATSSTRYWPLAASSVGGFALRRIVESDPAKAIKVRRKRQRYNGRRFILAPVGDKPAGMLSKGLVRM